MKSLVILLSPITVFLEFRTSSPYWPNPSWYFQAKTSDPITETCLKAKGLGEEIHRLVPSQGHWLKENSKMKARRGPPVTPITCNAAAGARPHRAFLLSRSSGGRGCSLGAAGSLLAQPAQVGSAGQSTQGDGCIQLRMKRRPLRLTPASSLFTANQCPHHKVQACTPELPHSPRGKHPPTQPSRQRPNQATAPPPAPARPERIPPRQASLSHVRQFPYRPGPSLRR